MQVNKERTRIEKGFFVPIGIDSEAKICRIKQNIIDRGSSFVFIDCPAREKILIGGL